MGFLLIAEHPLIYPLFRPRSSFGLVMVEVGEFVCFRACDRVFDGEFFRLIVFEIFSLLPTLDENLYIQLHINWP